MKRKLLSLILAFAVTASLLTVSAGAFRPAYGDTAGHWAERSIERWSGHGIVQGSDGLFDPDGHLTCAQLATILARLLKLPAAKDAGFTDNTPGAWYYDAINRCAAAGILKGNGDGTVTPDAPITRERAIVMLARALGIEPLGYADLSGYIDAAQVSAYAQGYLAAMIKAGIVGGVTADRLAPQDDIDRAATVTILDRAIGTYADQDGMLVDARDGALVLIVAKNVKVLNAPEGTRVIVVGGADGLSVNGKPVTDDQTYIVPKDAAGGTPSSGADFTHYHSYDASTHKCSCGAFDPAVVATIGNANGYLTLQDALAAAADGDTLTVIKDVETKNSADTFGARIIIRKKITLNLNGKIISPDDMGNNNNNFCALIIAADTIINANENGGINTGSNGGYAINVIGGAKLTINGGSYYGGGTAVQVEKGDVTINGGSFAVEPFGEPYGYNFLLNCIDAAYKNGTAKIAVAGGTFEKFNPADNTAEGEHTSFVAAGYESRDKGNGTWTVSEKTGVTFAAQVGANKYETLAEAFAAAQSGDTVKLVADTTLTGSVEINKSITLDLNGKTIHYTGKNQNTATQTHRALNITSGTVTIKSGTITTTVAGTDYPTEFDAVIVKSGAEVTLEDMNITINDAKGSCLYVFAGGKATVKSGSYTNTNTSGERLLLNQADNTQQLLFVEGGTFDGRSPADGDNSGKPSTFLAEGYTAKTLEDGKHQVVALFNGGTGTANDPFVIQNAEQLKALRDSVNAGNDLAGKAFRLTANIDLNGEEWTPIGTSGHPFRGVFDGGNNAISNLKITGGGYIGLFGYINVGAEIKNVKLAGADVSGSERVGGLIGQIIGDATVANCSIDAASKVTGTDSNTGGLIGAAQCGSTSTISLSNLTNYAAVTNTAASNSRAGGIIGQVTRNANVTITNCHNHGVLSAANGYAGGIVAAYQNGSLTINGCTNTKPLSDFAGTHKADLVAWITSVRALTINADGEVTGDMIGLIENDYSRNFEINGSRYFLNKTDESFTFASALESKQSLDTARMDRIIDFYTFAKTKNSNFAPYPNPNEYWEMFVSVGGFGGDGWPQLLEQYNKAYPDKNLTKEEFAPTWRDVTMYFYTPAQGE